ncbi:MAG: hypothetical protein Q9190_005245 [Brigantiaea leucoxantha]
MLLRKDQLEASLHEEKKLIEDGKLKEDNPLDLSENFNKLCEACRRGDLKLCQEMITAGVNINARDRFDYTPLILASLCGHYEVVQLLLESGALCERDTFQGERCLYNALNDRIRNLLLSYDYSKSTDPLQPFAAHVTSLLTRDTPKTSDLVVASAGETFHLHKFVLSARSPYFRKKLSTAPETTSWKIPPAIPPQAFGVAMRYVYLGEIPNELGGGPGTGFSDEEILKGLDKISKHLEIRSLWDAILENDDRRLSRQRRTEEVEKGRSQLDAWYTDNVLKHKVIVETEKADEIQWNRDNAIFADVLLRADEPAIIDLTTETSINGTRKSSDGIPIGPLSSNSRSPSTSRAPRQSTLFPVHRAMLLRSDFFLTMFSSGFREAQPTHHLQIISVDCSPQVLEAILTFFYTEKTAFPLDIAIDVLFAADLFLIERLKLKAAVIISTLGNGTMHPHHHHDIESREHAAQEHEPPLPQQAEQEEQEVINIYDIIRAGWLTRVPRLEEFGARYLAHRLESYIDDEDFAELIRESASRIKGRQETDSIELLDDIRYYLSERFRLRFEEAGLEDMMDEETETGAAAGIRGEVTGEREELDDDVSQQQQQQQQQQQLLTSGAVRTLDGEIAGDEFAGDAINFQILLGKIDALLERLMLDA